MFDYRPPLDPAFAAGSLREHAAAPRVSPREPIPSLALGEGELPRRRSSAAFAPTFEFPGEGHERAISFSATLKAATWIRDFAAEIDPRAGSPAYEIVARFSFALLHANVYRARQVKHSLLRRIGSTRANVIIAILILDSP